VTRAPAGLADVPGKYPGADVGAARAPLRFARDGAERVPDQRKVLARFRLAEALLGVRDGLAYLAAEFVRVVGEPVEHLEAEFALDAVHELVRRRFDVRAARVGGAAAIHGGAGFLQPFLLALPERLHGGGDGLVHGAEAAGGDLRLGEAGRLVAKGYLVELYHGSISSMITLSIAPDPGKVNPAARG
jgi:hypothetical protein